MSEERLLEFRKRARRRAGAMMALVIGPLVLVGAAVKVVQVHDYPAGDLRNEPVFWMVTGAFFLLVIGGLIFSAIRELRRAYDWTDGPNSERR
jgi:hypothetical protein